MEAVHVHQYQCSPWFSLCFPGFSYRLLTTFADTFMGRLGNVSVKVLLKWKQAASTFTVSLCSVWITNFPFSAQMFFPFCFFLKACKKNKTKNRLCMAVIAPPDAYPEGFGEFVSLAWILCFPLYTTVDTTRTIFIQCPTWNHRITE